MADDQTTCWTLIHAAAEGGDDERAEFTLRYEPVIRAYLGARWGNSLLGQEISAACQDFFVECFREGGPLDRVQRERAGGFRAFLYGVVRNIALRWEERFARQRARHKEQEVDLGALELDETSLSRVFDRAWATAVLKEADQRQTENAQRSGPDASRRVELLQLRFRDGLPIRDIAKRWETDASHLHREYAKARGEFAQALQEVVSFHHPDATAAQVQHDCQELMGLLS